MNFNLVKPCANCPFRTDIPAFLTKRRAEEIAESIIDMQQTFPCHKTTVAFSNDDGEMMTTHKSEHCAGALILIERVGRPHRMVQIAERLGMYDRSKLDMNSPVFDSVDDWIEAQF